MQHNPQTMIWRRKASVLGISGALGLGLLAYWILVPSPLEVDAALVTQGTFVQEIEAEAYFRSRDIRVITAFANGEIIEAIKVKAGESVKKDQVLGVLYWDRKMAIRAPMDGVISRVYRSDLGPITRGQPIVEIIDPTQLEVVAELLTPDAVKVQPGSPVLITGWGGSETIKSEVTRVSQSGFIKLSALGVEEERTEVVAELKHTSPGIGENLGSRFHSEVRIEIQRLDHVLKVPVGALVRQGDGWAVFKVIDGKASLQNIVAGLRNNDELVVQGGLQAGDQVIVYPGDDVRDKTRVRAMNRGQAKAP